MAVSRKIPIRFFFVTFAWSWVWWLLAILMGKGALGLDSAVASGMILAVSVMGAFGPAVGAFVSLRTLEGKGAIRDYSRRFFDLNFGVRAWVIPVVALGGTTFMAWIVPELWGESRVSMYLPNLFVFPVYWLMMVFVGGGQEEIGWRGYIRPFLERRFGQWGGSIVLGGVWAFWHIPLWFVVGANQQYMNFGGFLLLTIGYSMLFSWAMRESGEKPLIGMIAHGTANALIPVFPVVMQRAGASQSRYWLWVTLTLAIGGAILALGRRRTAR